MIIELIPYEDTGDYYFNTKEELKQLFPDIEDNNKYAKLIGDDNELYIERNPNQCYPNTKLHQTIIKELLQLQNKYSFVIY